MSLVRTTLSLATKCGHVVCLFVAPYYAYLWAALGLLLTILAYLFKDAYKENDSIPEVLGAAWKYASNHPILLIPVLGLLGLFLVASFGKRLQTLKTAFKLCVPTEDLTRDDLGFRDARPNEQATPETFSQKRPFYGTYISRRAKPVDETAPADDEASMENAEEELAQMLRAGGRLLLVGPPGSGKTLTIYEVLRRMPEYVVVSPNSSSPVPEQETFDLLKGRKVVILLDNLSTVRSDYDLALFAQRIDIATRGRYTVAASCQDGGEINAVVNRHASLVTQFSETLSKFRMPLISVKDRMKLATSTGMPLSRNEALHEYVLPGDITTRKTTLVMASRFRELGEAEKDVLRAMKLLNSGGIFPNAPRLQHVLRGVFNRDVEAHAIADILRTLRHQHFLLKEPFTGPDCIHAGYLSHAVTYEEGPEATQGRWAALARTLENAKDVEGLLYLGSNKRDLGDLERTLYFYDSVLRIDPTSAEAHFQRGYTLARLFRNRKANIDDALEANARALELREDFAEAWNNKGYMLFLIRDLSGAEKAFRRALELRPKYDDAHTNLAKVLARMDRFQDAEKEFAASLGVRPDNYYAYLNWGITLSRQGLLDKALEAYDRALQVRPDYPEAYFNRGITLAKMKKLEEALAAHDKAIELRDEFAEAHMHRGQTLARLQRNEEAVEAHGRAIELRDDYALAYLNRGLTYGHMGRKFVKEAEKDGRTAFALGDVPTASVLGIAKSLAVNGSLDNGLAMMDEIIKIEPNFADAHFERGITLAHLDRLPEALGEFNRALELGADQAELHHNMGMALVAVEDYAEARDAFCKVIELQPTNVAALVNRARTCATLGHRGDLENAKADWDEVLRLDSDNAEAHKGRGITLARLRRYTEAFADYEKALKLEPDDANTRVEYARSICFYVRGFPLDREKRLTDAIAMLEEAVGLNMGLLRQIQNSSAFDVLKNHRQLRDRFDHLAWVTTS